MHKQRSPFRRVRRRHSRPEEADIFNPESMFEIDDIDYACGGDKEKAASE